LIPVDLDVTSDESVAALELPELDVFVHRGDGLVVWVGGSSTRGGTPP
jgi:hypothetical protein